MEAAKFRLLLVDDDAEHCGLMRRRFEPLGFVVDAVGSGAAALKVIEETSYDLVLLDIGLPDMDGVQVLQEIRAELGPSQLCVIMVTGSALIADIVRSRRAGANDYVSKPVDFSQLFARVKAQLQGKKKRRTAAPAKVSA